MTARLTTDQVAEDISSHVQQDYCDSEEEVEEGEEQVRETLLLKDGKMEWSSVSYNKRGRTAERNLRLKTMMPGPTSYAISHAHDTYLFITPAIEEIILDMTNLEGRRKYGDNWKGIDGCTPT